MKQTRSRRRFLGLSAAVVASLAGCTINWSKTPRSDSKADTDGDGVPDNYDYAPLNPNVQSENDSFGRTTTTAPLMSTPTTGTPTPTTYEWGELNETLFQTTTIALNPTTSNGNDFNFNESLLRTETTTTESLTDLSLPSNEVAADTNAIAGRTSHFTAYSTRRVTIALVRDTVTNENLYTNGARLFVIAVPYPDELFADEEAYAYGMSAPFEPSTTTKQSVPLTFEVTPDVSFYLQAYIVPRDATVENPMMESAEYIAETNRLRINDDRLSSEEPVSEAGDYETTGFMRESAEGCFVLEFTGTEGSRNWNASFIAYKANYVEQAQEIRASDRAAYVQYAQESGMADLMASILKQEAKANGFTDKREQVQFIIEFVQNLPYVPDDVSTEYDDYMKSVTETLVDGGGDCEDTAVLMAAVLQAEEFNYDCILIQPPGHMAVGVYGTDLPGTYWEHEGRRYYYLETTGNGWEIGEIPEEYKDDRAYLHPV